MAYYRVLRTTLVTLSQRFSQDETPVNAAGDVTVTVKRLDGTAIVGSPFTAAHPGETGLYTLALPAQANVDVLTLDWSGSVGGATVVVRDLVEVVGGFLFPLPTARAAHKGLRQPPGRFSTADLAWWRTVVEVEAEDIIGHAQVPRFGRARVDGSGTDALPLGHLFITAVRACSIDGVALSAGDVANLVPTEAGVVYKPPGGWWPVGRRNIIIEYEHGLMMPSPGVAEQATQRMRSIMEGRTSQIPDRAVSWQTGEGGGVFRIALPTATSTGIPTIDAVYHRARIDGGGFA